MQRILSVTHSNFQLIFFGKFWLILTFGPPVYILISTYRKEAQRSTFVWISTQFHTISTIHPNSTTAHSAHISGNCVLIHPIASECLGATCLQLETITSCPSSTSSSIFSTNPFLRHEICTKPSRVAPMSTKTPYSVISTILPL